jgi:hypothetical protein
VKYQNNLSCPVALILTKTFEGFKTHESVMNAQESGGRKAQEFQAYEKP